MLHQKVSFEVKSSMELTTFSDMTFLVNVICRVSWNLTFLDGFKIMSIKF